MQLAQIFPSQNAYQKAYESAKAAGKDFIFTKMNKVTDDSHKLMDMHYDLMIEAINRMKPTAQKRSFSQI